MCLQAEGSKRGALPVAVFKMAGVEDSVEVPRLSRYDTDDSQRLLEYKNHGFDDFVGQLRALYNAAIS